MLSETPLEDWFYAFLGGMGIGVLFVGLNLIEGDLPRHLTWGNMILFCVMIGLGFSVTAMSLVLWEDRKKQKTTSEPPALGRRLGEWVLITLWTTAVLSSTMSSASFFYSGDWFILIMLAVFAPLSALLAAYVVSRGGSLERGEDRRKQT